jgi:peptidyl-tRNA hydrolase, PTH1 family
MADLLEIQLIVGLGNPGREYENTRHNAGIWFLQRLINKQFQQLTPNKKFRSKCAEIALFEHCYHVLIPMTYMNLSGEAVGAFVRFYKIPHEAILIAHDDMDLPPGIARFKQGGGDGGHQGLRNIIQQLGDAHFNRVRIGIGHPEHRAAVIDYVLQLPPRHEQQLIITAIDRAIECLPMGLEGHWGKAMNQLHASSTSQ